MRLKSISVPVSDEFLRLLKLTGVSPYHAMKCFVMMTILERSPVAHAHISKNMYKVYHLPGSFFRKMDEIAKELAREAATRKTLSRIANFKDARCDIHRARQFLTKHKADTCQSVCKNEND